MIESMTNSQVKRIHKLKKSARFRRQEKCFIVEGFKMVEEALRHHMVEVLYVSEDAREEYLQKVSHILDGEKIEWVASPIFGQMSDTQTPQGIMALVQMPDYERETILAQADVALICLEDVQDPGNLGTIMRTAEGAGMNGVVLSKGCVDLFNPKVVRSTMGALFRVPFYITENMTTEVECLNEAGFTTYAAYLGAKREYTECDWSGRTAVLIGNEAKGLCSETAQKAGETISIPMDGQLESLNAAVSAALFMYEIRRKRACKKNVDIVQ